MLFCSRKVRVCETGLSLSGQTAPPVPSWLCCFPGADLTAKEMPLSSAPCCLSPHTTEQGHAWLWCSSGRSLKQKVSPELPSSGSAEIRQQRSPQLCLQGLSPTPGMPHNRAPAYSSGFIFCLQLLLVFRDPKNLYLGCSLLMQHFHVQTDLLNLECFRMQKQRWVLTRTRQGHRV